MASQFFAVLASAGLIGAGVASAAETRSFDALPVIGMAGAAADNLCRVDVIRNGAPGSAAVTRAVEGDSCVCTITTGPANGNGSAENIVSALLRDRSCEGAPAPARTNAGEVVSTSTGGGSGTVLAAVVGVGAAAGLAVALGNDSGG